MASDTSSGRRGSGADRTSAPQARRWLALSVILVAGFMDLLDVTIVNVALPTILEDLKAEYAQVEWVIAGYVLGFAAVLITGGRLGDIFGRRKLFLIGITGFTIASALCGLSVNPVMLIGSRFLQGAMAGLMVPQILAIIHVTFPAEERGKVLGIWGGVLGSASAAGLIFGGLLVEADLFDLSWRPIFLVNVPVGIAAAIVALFVVPESRSPAAPRLDLVGMVLAVSGVLMLVYPLLEGRSLGWPVWTYLLMIGSGLVVAAFVAYERWRTRTAGSPLVVLSLFRTRTFTAGMAIWLVFWIAAGGFYLVWTLYMQVGLGWTPLHAGLTALAYAIAAGAGAGMSVQVFTPKFGRSVLLAGAVLNAAGFAAYAWAVVHYGPGIGSWQMVVPLAVIGFGFGLVVAPMVDAILTGVPIRDAGSGSGLLNTLQQVGMAVGVGLVGVVFFFHLADDSDRGVNEVTTSLRAELTAAGVPSSAQDETVARFRACVHDRSSAVDPTDIPPSCEIPASQPGAAGLEDVFTRVGLEANAHNFARAFGMTLWYGAAMLILVFIGLFALPRRVQIRAMDVELGAMVQEESIGEPATTADRTETVG